MKVYKRNGAQHVRSGREGKIERQKRALRRLELCGTPEYSGFVHHTGTCRCLILASVLRSKLGGVA